MLRPGCSRLAITIPFEFVCQGLSRRLAAGITPNDRRHLRGDPVLTPTGTFTRLTRTSLAGHAMRLF